MRSALNRLLSWIRQKTGLHLSSGDLQATVDGEMTADQESRVRIHLARCETEDLEKGLRLFEHVDSTIQPGKISLDRGYHELQSAIQAWNDANPQPQPAAELVPPLSPAQFKRLVAELGIYVGPRTAQALLQRFNYAGFRPQTLTETIEQIVSSFFGRQTGLAVTTKVLRVWNSAHEGAAPSGLTS